MEESLKLLEIDLSDCKTHHSDIKVVKQDCDVLKSQIQTLENENKFLKEKVQKKHKNTQSAGLSGTKKL